jgi:hypothetical protein
LLENLLTSKWLAIQSLGPLHATDNQVTDVIVGQNINTGVAAENEGSENDSQYGSHGDPEHGSEEQGKKESKPAEGPSVPKDSDIEGIAQKFNERAKAFLERAKEELIDMKAATKEARENPTFWCVTYPELAGHNDELL